MKYLAVLLLAFCCNNAFAQTTHAPKAFRVKIMGSGEQPILFIPGFVSSGAVWDSTRAMFDNQFTTYTFTMAGFAGVPPQKNPTFKSWRKAIGSYMKKHQLNNAIIVGHSMGGLLAMALAANYPKLVSKVVVVDAVPFYARFKRPGFKAQEHPKCANTIKMIMSMNNQQFRRMEKLTVQVEVADSSKRNLVLGWALHSDRRTIGKMLCSFVNTDLIKEIGKIKCPVLILLDTGFKSSKPRVQKQFKNLSTVTIKYAPKGSHFLMYGAKNGTINS